MSDVSTYPNLKASWQERFRIFDSVNVSADSYFQHQEKINDLPRKEKKKVSLNWLAFLFNILYYYAKGMGTKGTLLWVIATLTHTVVVSFAPQFAMIASWLVSAAIANAFANTDFYRKVKFDEKGWPFLPSFLDGPVGAIVLLVVAIVINGTVMYMVGQ